MKIDINLEITVHNVHLLTEIGKEIEKGMTVNKEQLYWICKKYSFWRKKIRFNKKTLNEKKLINILKNNLCPSAKFRIKLVKRTKPFYIGDYHYFLSARDCYRKDARIENELYYIDVLE